MTEEVGVVKDIVHFLVREGLIRDLLGSHGSDIPVGGFLKTEDDCYILSEGGFQIVLD